MPAVCMCACARVCVCVVDFSSSYRHILIPGRMTWCGARSYCQQRHADLAVIRDQSQYDEVTQIKSSSPFWIGLKSYGWEWSDGACFDYRNVPGKIRQTDCQYLRLNENYPNYPIHAGDCNSKFKALCYKGE